MRPKAPPVCSPVAFTITSVPKNHSAWPSSLASAYGRVPISMACSPSVGPCLSENLRVAESEVHPLNGLSFGTPPANFRELPLPEVRFPRRRRLRGSANRSRSLRGSSLPAVAAPALSNQPPDDDDHVLREAHPEVHHSPPPLGAPHQLLVGVLPGVGALHHPAPRGV